MSHKLQINWSTWHSRLLIANSVPPHSPSSLASFLEYGSCRWFMDGNDLRFTYPPFNNSCSASYAENCIAFPTQFPVLQIIFLSILTCCLLSWLCDSPWKKNEHELMLHIYQTLYQPFDVGYLYKMINSSLKKVLFLTPSNFFHVTRLRKVKEPAHCHT